MNFSIERGWPVTLLETQQQQNHLCVWKGGGKKQKNPRVTVSFPLTLQWSGRTKIEKQTKQKSQEPLHIYP